MVITKEWLNEQLRKMEQLGVDEIHLEVPHPARAVVCKMQCHGNVENPQSDPEQPHLAQIRLGAVWEGSTDLQRASENAIFGHHTPNGSIDLTIRNPNASSFFVLNQKYYCTFTKAPD